MPELGKNVEFILFNYEVRQLTYKKHRMLYYLKDNYVVILAVLHTRLDINKALKKLKRDIK